MKIKYKSIRGILLILLVICITTFIYQEKNIVKLNEKKETKQKELKKLNDNIDYLTNTIENSDEIEYIEQIARNELDMVKPGETMYEDVNKR